MAYTATPFANVLIDPDAIDHTAGQDLFPRNFIISLPRPPGYKYVGAERLFGRSTLDGETEPVQPLDVIEIVPSAEVTTVVPPRGAGADPLLPRSLKKALNDYLLASAARLYRSGIDVPCTMLVHIDMRKAVQDSVSELIERELAHIRQQWKYDSSRDLRKKMRKRWEENFRPTSAALNVEWDVPFREIEPVLSKLINENFEVRTLNSNHLDKADFEEEPCLKAVLVGGNKLSRGVTIEGLLVSYFVRATPYYDTLLQMGRWFGYRGDYVDLTRIYTTKTLISWFHDLALAEEDLRRQIELYDREKLTPLQLAPKIMAHPAMLVTAENKMRAASTINQCYEGQLIQTLRFPFGSDRLLQDLDSNLEVTRRLLRTLGTPTDSGKGLYGWREVDVEQVASFLAEFTIIDQSCIDGATALKYIRAQQEQGELTRWRIRVHGLSTADSSLGVEDLGIQGFSSVGLIRRTRLKKDPTSLGALTEPDDEWYGIEPEDVRLAREQKEEGRFPTYGQAYRSKRSPEEGLLIIYPISPNSVPEKWRENNRIPLFNNGEERRTVIGYALSFPASKSAATVTYIQGPGGIPA